MIRRFGKVCCFLEKLGSNEEENKEKENRRDK